MSPSVKYRWVCPSCKTERSTYALKQIGDQRWPLANDHLWYPIRGAGEHTDMRKCLLLYRNLVESAFAIMKGIGVGTDEPALWAQDLGIVHLIGMHLTLRSARRLAHENGTYTLLVAEHDKLGLGRKGAKLPSSRKMRRHRRKRPKHLRWTWPTPQRLEHPATDTRAGNPRDHHPGAQRPTLPTTASPRPPAGSHSFEHRFAARFRPAGRRRRDSRNPRTRRPISGTTGRETRGRRRPVAKRPVLPGSSNPRTNSRILQKRLSAGLREHP